MMYNAICESHIYFIIYVLWSAFEISAAQSIICIIHGKELMMANRPELKQIKWLSLKAHSKVGIFEMLSDVISNLERNLCAHEYTDNTGLC